ncbi:diguanylate cyclase [Sutcliffiella rhizosphaerae]|uniref:GGDEF domain-containing protein n=1 Tax=Sutcliffiella rhizosphaerae TaxID=2880967 RepID=A0ABM8YKH4_9BACI|nr:diguanylate cyclase [Sutcliffiella rhizosphaerae]CAG9620300.1 hypothetical protein BACCIP111883_01068 [Sutcliffiella rhizosphaerae]
MKFISSKLLILFFFIYFLLSFPLYSKATTDPIVVPEQFTEISLTKELHIYLDNNSEMPDEEILQKQEEFLSLQEANVSGDLSDVTYWIKVTLLDEASFNRELLLELKKPHLSSVELFSVKNESLLLEEKMGYQYPFNMREIDHRNLVFPLQLSSQQAETFYLKIKTNSFFQAPVSLWEPIAFSAANYEAQTLFGIYYGVMLAMIAYNSFLFLSLKDRAYLYYICFIMGFMMLQLIWDGFAFQWLWGDYPWFALRSNAFFIIWNSLFSLQFAKHFLQLKTYAPYLNKIANIFITICSILLFVPFILDVTTSTRISMLLATVFVILLITTVMKVRLYTREAKFFILAWSLLFFGVIINLLAAYKVIPLTPIALYAPKIGSLVVVIVLSLGLADKIKRITAEKEREARKYYIQTLLQNSFSQLGKIKDFPTLIERGLQSLMAVTKYEKGIYLVYENEEWKLIKKTSEDITINQPIPLYKPSLEKKLTNLDIHPEAFGIEDDINTLFCIPITTEQHTGMFVVYSEEWTELQSFEEDIIFPSFTEQLTLFISNIKDYQLLKETVMYDHLTKVFTRKYFIENADDLIVHAFQSEQPISLLLLDIDHFKQVNDNYGHAIGDLAIQFVAKNIQEVCKENGIVGRFGGEEFIVLLPNTTNKQASQIAEKLINAHRQQPFVLENGPSLSITISIGVCTSDQYLMSLEDMFQCADEALYEAKNQGRNQVVVYS